MQLGVLSVGLCLMFISSSTSPLHLDLAKAQENMTVNTTKMNIILVHGAWADGSSWSKVIPILENSGYRVSQYSFLNTL